MPCANKIFAALGAAVLSFSSVAAETGLKIVPAFPGLRFEEPLFLAYPPDGTDRIFVAEQAGRIYWFDNNRRTDKKHLALDISGKVRTTHTEEGLLGVAFHPDFKTNGLVFLHYSASGPRRNVLSRFAADPTRQRILPDSEEILFEIDQPYGNHNGGMIAFGPDGYLYLALGDGGWAGDPNDHAQNKGSLLGKILRLDVNRRSDGKRYAVPGDNPFVGDPKARPEVWAYGLRNVWRFSFDRETGELWAGDVGQDRWEEINLIKKGLNYGWNVKEGRHDFRPQGRAGPFEPPVVEHAHPEAQSITGGNVYRGKKHPDLRGAYLYADYITGLVWLLRREGEKVTEHRRIGRGELIASFGEDRHGEVYFTSYDGRIYTFDR